jgi:hypothetical protein
MFKKTKIWIAVSVYIGFAVFVSFVGVHADTVNPLNNLDIFTYSFHLYYDHGQLSADRDFQIKYDLIAGQFMPEALRTNSPYTGKIINVQGKTDATFRFDPKKGNLTFTKGKITIKAPYFADAAKASFYNDKGKLLLTIDIGGSSFCNDNKVCDSSVGENYLNCPVDCPAPVTPTPAPTIAKGFFSTSVGIGLGLLVLIVIVVLAVWFIIKRRRKAVEPEQVPPVIPPITQ